MSKFAIGSRAGKVCACSHERNIYVIMSYIYILIAYEISHLHMHNTCIHPRALAHASRYYGYELRQAHKPYTFRFFLVRVILSFYFLNTIVSITDGLALCALIHHFHPNLVDFKALRAQNKTQNITIGIQAASKLGVPQVMNLKSS